MIGEVDLIDFQRLKLRVMAGVQVHKSNGKNNFDT